MLFSTSLVALTLSPRVLRIQNTKVSYGHFRVSAGTDNVKRHSTICEMTFRTAILAMRMNRKRLVVVLESELYIYDISNMQMLKTEKTSPNPNGTPEDSCDLYALTDLSYMCSVCVLRKQLPRIPATHESRTRYLPTPLACAAQIRSYRSDQRGGPHIRCYQDGGGERHRSAQLPEPGA